MFDIVNVQLDLILGNPFQTRSIIDPAHVEKLADSIFEVGLQSPPQARQHPDRPGHYQLVFGHTRLAAFKLLSKLHPNDARWAHLPLYSVTLDDRQMYESGLTENIFRVGISCIAKAHAMDIYIHKFKATQTECGKLFGLSQSSIANLLCLLRLPQAIQDYADKGKLSERAARVLSRMSANEALAIAEEAIKLDTDLRSTYVTNRVTAMEKERAKGKAGRRKLVEHSNSLLAPDACPGCWKVPRSYVRMSGQWQCGDCKTMVKLHISLPTTEKSQ